jgi:hypothetical protein
MGLLLASAATQCAICVGSEQAVAKATARSAESGAVIHACYRKSGGALRLVRAGAHCKRGEAPLQWSTSGPPGAPGSQGPAGPPGSNGVTGATGASNVSGARGAPGAPGLEGGTGATGATGPAGVTGATGARGATGPTGLPGGKGIAGAVGPTGARGTAGAAATGATGAAGATGATGPTGASGPAGATPALEENLASGHSESGIWSAAVASTIEHASRPAGAAISFTVPLGSPITESSHVQYMNQATSEGTEGVRPAGCKKGTIEAPQAEAGFLCVFTAREANISAAFKALENASGEAGKTSRDGAYVIFESTSGGATTQIRDFGSWAVTAP